MLKLGCPKCKIISFLIISFSAWQIIDCCQTIIENSLFSIISFNRTFSASHSFLNYKDTKDTKDKKIKGYYRIGPHNRDIISIIFGSLLGKGTAERKKDGTRIIFFQEAMHVKYLLFLHNKLALAGYCNSTVPNIGRNLGKKGKVRKIIRFST
jgi:hypothetical protein